MALADLARRHLLWIGAGIGLLLGAAIGLFLPIRAASAPAAAEDAWNLPPKEATGRMRSGDYQRLRQVSLWSGGAGPRRRTAQAQWRLLAIETRPRLRAAVQAGGAQKPEWIAIGGRLPDGSQLVAMDRDAVWSDADGCRRVRRLYAAATGQDPNACIDGTGSTAAAAAPASPPVAAPRAAPAATSQDQSPPQQAAPTPADAPAASGTPPSSVPRGTTDPTPPAAATPQPDTSDRPAPAAGPQQGNRSP